MPRLPPARVCLVAEQVRAEVANKSTILGFFGVSPDAIVLVQNFPIPIQLALMVLCDAVTVAGNPGLELQMLGPSQQHITPRINFVQPNDPEVGRGAIVALNFQGIVMPAAGRYSMVLYSMGEIHSTHHFECLTPADLENRRRGTVQ
jgi:hypothetical protein